MLRACNDVLMSFFALPLPWKRLLFFFYGNLTLTGADFLQDRSDVSEAATRQGCEARGVQVRISAKLFLPG